ncbi:MAG: FG-GAP-like repeat-containing protein, partial [Oscillospiraceae bacterium]|nr:FG-GAP-like repeat-containing protein [Oscillospiraceae bacterium]
MKQTGKRVLSILLMMLFLCSLAAIGMMSASAEVWVTRDAAIAWVKAQADAGVKYDIDGMYLCQCSDFASAYINYLRNGNPFTGISTYNGYQYKDISYPSDWQKIANTPTLIPEPGDILVFNGTSLNPNGHVSVALEGCTTTVCRSVEQSGATPNKGAYYAVGGYSDSYNIFWGVVRPKFKNATPPAKPTMSANKTVVPIGDTVTFTFNAAGATNYTIGIDRQNPEGAWSRVITQAVTSGCSFTLDGSYYSAYVTASNGAGGADSDKVYFNVGVGGRSVSGDFNGDGKTDYATLFDYGNGRMKIHVFLSTGTKFSEEIWYESMTPGWYPLDKVSGRVVAGDFNGDGLCDVAAMYDYGTTPENGQKSQWHVWLSTGSSFQKWQAWHTQTQYPLNNMTDKVVAGDFNGDGKDDIAAIYYYNWSGMNEVRAHVWLSTGEKLNGAYTWATNTQYGGFNINGRVVAGDFNGDGKDDIAAMYDYGNAECRFHVWQSTGNAFTGWTSWRYGTQFHASNVTGRMVAGDFNGDGLCDIAAMYDYGSNTARMFVWLSTGSSFPLSANWWEAMTIGSYAPSNATGRMVAGDFNGDGLCDIAAMYDYDRSYSTFHMFMSDKTKFTNPWWNRVNGYNARRTTGFVGCTDNYTEKFSLVKLAKYTISYNANDGTGAPAAQTKWQDVALTLSSTRPTRSGYTFLGWSTSSTATTATYQPGGSYTANANVTLSAVWQIIPPTTYVLTVQNGSGSGSYEAGTRITITANAAPTGKVFDEWTTPVGGIENSNFATATFIMPALSTTVTATYKDVPVSTYTLTVNQGTGSGSYEAGTAVNIKADQPPAGKHFVKW